MEREADREFNYERTNEMKMFVFFLVWCEMFRLFLLLNWFNWLELHLSLFFLKGKKTKTSA